MEGISIEEIIKAINYVLNSNDYDIFIITNN